jgi:hypothetical protein
MSYNYLGRCSVCHNGLDYCACVGESSAAAGSEREAPLSAGLSKDYEFSTQEDTVKAMEMGRELYEFGKRQAARAAAPPNDADYWKSRATTAELKVLTFTEEIANLRAVAPAAPSRASCFTCKEPLSANGLIAWCENGHVWELRANAPAPHWIAEQIFFHVLMKGGEGNPFRSIRHQWFVELAAPKISEIMRAPAPPNREPVAYMCPKGCGCLWRDNHDGTMSLYGPNSKSCQDCEFMSLNSLIPVAVADSGASAREKERK